MTATSTAPATSAMLATADHRRAEAFRLDSIEELPPSVGCTCWLYIATRSTAKSQSAEISQGAYPSRRIVYSARTDHRVPRGRGTPCPRPYSIPAAPFFSWAVRCGATRVSNAGRSAAAAPSPEVRRPRPAFSQREGGPCGPPCSTAQRRLRRVCRLRGEESRRNRRISVISCGRSRGNPPDSERKWAQNGQDE